ncbi:TIGR03862 family flavoprotein [Chitinibacteraceae bacterium HSL-7]
MARVAIIGAGPAGLMAAEVLLAAGHSVDVFDAMPSPARKFLLAGVGGMNITHSESLEPFLARYGEVDERLTEMVRAFDGEAVRHWIHGLGVETFVGSSGRVFPTGMKAAPLLRAWLARLKTAGMTLHVRHRWQGWQADGALSFNTPSGEQDVAVDAVVMALGGASWPRLGSDGAWQRLLGEKGVGISPLLAANCGFEVAWSDFLRERFAGAPLKTIVASCTLADGSMLARKGECVVSEHGIEGSVIYALSRALREALLRDGKATLTIDLLPDLAFERVLEACTRSRGSKSLSSHLAATLKLSGVKMALVNEVLGAAARHDGELLARTIKALPLTLLATRPVDEAISSAGGVSWSAVDESLMLTALPGVFVAGEMLDWEAPTGGYLLTACFATGRAAGAGAARWLALR